MYNKIGFEFRLQVDHFTHMAAIAGSAYLLSITAIINMIILYYAIIYGNSGEMA
jgi:hypothetical protein